MTWPGHAEAAEWFIQSAMCGADQQSTVRIEELAFLPIHLHVSMGAAVEVGHGPAGVTYGERLLDPVTMQHRKPDAMAAVAQHRAGADPVAGAQRR